ncbi:MAG: hypothetical protein AB7D39_16105 [Pseudodesulfovibrio sp.]|uniref:hypothetical protein n=1 Tax=Pseudodesulfovibrio sp. TaxID=2035812 RepID=UPI003D0BD100
MKHAANKESESAYLPSDHWLTRKGKAVIHLFLAALAGAGWVYSGTMFAYIAVPVVAVSAVVLLVTIPFFRSAAYRYFAAFTLYLFAAPFVLAGFSFALANLCATTRVYSVGFEMRTPDGSVTLVNHITVEDRRTPIKRLRQFYSGPLSMTGKARIATIGPNRTLVTLLSPQDRDDTSGFLRGQLARKPLGIYIDASGGITRHLLSNRSTPVMLLLPEADTPEGLRTVTPESFADALGPGYSFVRAWMAAAEVKPSVPSSDAIPWWDYETDRPLNNAFSLYASKLRPDMFDFQETGKAVFLRM